MSECNPPQSKNRDPYQMYARVRCSFKRSLVAHRSLRECPSASPQSRLCAIRRYSFPYLFLSLQARYVRLQVQDSDVALQIRTGTFAFVTKYTVWVNRVYRTYECSASWLAEAGITISFTVVWELKLCFQYLTFWSNTALLGPTCLGFHSNCYIDRGWCEFVEFYICVRIYEI